MSYGARLGPPIHFSLPPGFVLDSRMSPLTSITSAQTSALNTKCSGRRLSNSRETGGLSVTAGADAATPCGAGVAAIGLVLTGSAVLTIAGAVATSTGSTAATAATADAAASGA